MKQSSYLDGLLAVIHGNYVASGWWVALKSSHSAVAIYRIKAQFLYCFCYVLMINDDCHCQHSQSLTYIIADD